MLDLFIRFLRETPIPVLAALIVLENVFIFAGALLLGEWLARRFVARPVAQTPNPITRIEAVLALTTVAINALVTLGGLLLWRADVIRFRADWGWMALVDFVFLVLAMDLAMYVAHRFAHAPLFFKLIHRTHHEYDNPRPLTLFVMNPLEALSFGLMWLALVSLYDATWLGMSLYLAFNVAFGVVGHVGVEPLPSQWNQGPWKHISTSSFHAGHHHDAGYNFGFYTLIWDRLFNTLAPRYETDFAQRPRPQANAEP